MSYSNIRPQKSFGGAAFTRVRGQGSAAAEWLFYFKPDTGGTAYILMTRPEYYQSYSAWSITMSGEVTYENTNSGTDVKSYLHRVRVSGLKTGQSYDIRMSWFTENGDEVYVEIQRTYYCSNVSPSANPYSNDYGQTYVPAYKAGYPYYSINVECPDNESREDGRCRYDAATRDLFWRVCATDYETHPIGSSMSFQRTCRWPPGLVYVDVEYLNTANKTAIASRINEWIDWMNGLVDFAGVEFTLGSTTEKNAKQISVRVGTHKQLWGYDPDDAGVGEEVIVYGGTWQSVWWGDGILESEVKICCESRYPFNYCTPDFEGIVFEELTEASGPRYDQYSLFNTLFTEVHYPGKTVGGPPGESWTRDENVIRILYGLGYLKGTDDALNEYVSEFGSGIRFTEFYNSFGPLTSSSPKLFFQINATAGSITSEDGYTLPDTMDLVYKGQRAYSLRAVYANEIPVSQKELASGLSFRYTNPSAEGLPYFKYPNDPTCTSRMRINGGLKFGVTGLSISGEYYNVRAYLKDVTGADIDTGAYQSYGMSDGSKRSVSVTGMLYGRRYDIYLYSDCIGAESDWVHLGEATVAPKIPALSNVSHTDTSVTFTYDMAETKFDSVICALYRDGELVASSPQSSASNTVTINFDEADGNYHLKVYSVISAGNALIQCVDSGGNDTFAGYTFAVHERAYFYWSDYTSEVKPGGVISSIPYTAWNAFLQHIYDTVCVNKGIDGTIPNDSSEYASGFGPAAGQRFSTVLQSYASMSDSDSGRILSAGKFNMVNYIISACNPTGVSYKYHRSKGPSQVLAADLIILQDKLNEI